LRLVGFHRFFFFTATTSLAGDRSTSLYDLLSVSPAATLVTSAAI
jgi:hypothetical protein